jgi:integrase
VDIERRTAILGDTKTGLSIRPLSSASIEIIKRQQRREGQQLVFEHGHCKPISDMAHWFRKLRLPAEITPHTLRHSFASLAGDMGIADHLISGMIGHKRQGVTSRYMHLSNKVLIETADQVAGETLRLMGRGA